MAERETVAVKCLKYQTDRAILMGIAFGAGIGALMDNVGFGISIGIVIGYGIGVVIDFATKHKAEDGNGNHKEERYDS